MNTIFEATKFDGKRQLVSPSVIKGLSETAWLYSRSERGHFRKLGKLLANMMYCCDFALLVAITYDQDGNQTRTVICASAGF